MKMAKRFLVFAILLAALIAIILLFSTPEKTVSENNSIILTFDSGSNQTEIWQTSGNSILFKSHMLIDADGSPRAYHPPPDDYLGLDSLEFAGEPGNWWALAVDESGNPYIQDENDPAPGFYVSMTALNDDSNPDDSDPGKYVNSEIIPYFVLPQEVYDTSDARLGDLGIVYNTQNKKISCAILADIDGEFLEKNIGEGSIALANELGIDSDPRTGGIEEPVIIYLIFPGSGMGEGKLRTLQEINQGCQKNFIEWGGIEKLVSFT